MFAQSPSSTTPPIEISSSRLTKLTRRTTDRKSEFLKTLKDDRNGDFSENRDCDKLEDVRERVFLGHHRIFPMLYVWGVFLFLFVVVFSFPACLRRKMWRVFFNVQRRCL